MNTPLISLALPLTPDLASLKAAIASGIAYGFTYSGTECSGVRPISGVREVTEATPAMAGVGAEAQVEVCFIFLGKPAWMRMALDRIVAI